MADVSLKTKEVEAVSNLTDVRNSHFAVRSLSIFRGPRGQTPLRKSWLAAAIMVWSRCGLDAGMVGRWGT